MFTRIFKSRMLLTVLFTLLFALVMCKKEDDGTGTNYRVSKINYYYGDYLVSGSDLHYSGEKLNLIEEEYHPLGSSETGYTKTEVTYPEDSIVYKSFYLDNDHWAPLEMTFLEFDDSLISRASFAHGGTDVIRTVYEYQYAGNILTQRIEYLYEDLYQKKNYTYDGTHLVQTLTYSYENDWILSGLDTVFYHGDDVDSLISYEIVDGNRNNDRKHVYIHENGLLTQMDDYSGDTTSWRHIEQYLYTYDSHKNLASKSFESGGETIKWVYYYEKGTGNYQEIFSLPGSVNLENILLPDPAK